MSGSLAKCVCWFGSVWFTSVATAGSFGFTAAVWNNISGLNGADLAVADVVSLGTWDGATFTALGSVATSPGLSFGDSNDSRQWNGTFNGQVALSNTNAIAGAQLVLRWSEAASGLTGLMYYDITTGTDDARVREWTVKGGIGSGLDFAANYVDVYDLTVNREGELLDAAAVLGGVVFSGSYALTGNPQFQLAQPPVVSSTPSSQSAIAGGSATFSVTASGADISYQWHKDGVAISGATFASYTIASVSASHVGDYSVTIRNAVGSVASDAVSLSMDPFWEPRGWVYYSWPYAYSIDEQRWHFFSETDTQWRVGLSSGEWATLSEATGWNYYAWPYSYSSDQSTWHWYDSNTQWVVDLVSDVWARLGAVTD